jgi:hypothetical protein
VWYREQTQAGPRALSKLINFFFVFLFYYYLISEEICSNPVKKAKLGAIDRAERPEALDAHLEASPTLRALNPKSREKGC